MKQKRILILNGPNLNMLGKREPSIYGKETLEDMTHLIEKTTKILNLTVNTFQTNTEDAMIDKIQQSSSEGMDLIIINAGAWAHTSIAIRDALLSSHLPFIEVHISNVYAREPFRHQSYLRDIAIGSLCGFGLQGYELALRAAHHYLEKFK